MVEEADLVLALTRDHRKAALQMHPRANRYAFTIRELERLLVLAAADLPTAGEDVRSRLREVMGAAAAKRGFQALSDPQLDDVVDPYRGDTKVYGTAVDQMLPGIEALAAALRPPA
jgi:protein-tyrosine phosphatase